MNSSIQDYKTNLNSSKYWKNNSSNNNRKDPKAYCPYDGYQQKKYFYKDRSYQRKADYTSSKDLSPTYESNRKQRYQDKYDNKKYDVNISSPPVSKYDLTSSSVSSITSFDYNAKKKNYLDESRIDNLSKSHVSSIQSRNYHKEYQKDYSKDILKDKYSSYFSPSNSKTTTDDYQHPSQIPLDSYKTSYKQFEKLSQQYSTKSAKQNLKTNNNYSNQKFSKLNDKDNYKTSSYSYTSQQKLDKRFAKKKFLQQGKAKLNQINQLLAKSKMLNDQMLNGFDTRNNYKSAQKVEKIKFNIQISDFHIGRSKGQGKFGTVYQAIHKATGSIYAVKKIPKQIIKSHMLEAQLALEIKLQSYIDHPNILKMYGFFDDWQNVYIVLEYMQEGTLFEYLKKRQNKLSQKQTSKKIKQMTSAIKYLHYLDIAHRDIKPQNIVISNGVAKLCDFGWSTRCTDRRKTYCGTFDYAAPQILEGKQYDWCVDLWCLGVLTFELLTGKAPFYHISRKQTMKKILRIDRDQIYYPKDMSWKAKDFIQSLLKKNPNQRRIAQDLINHPFISEQK